MGTRSAEPEPCLLGEGTTFNTSYERRCLKSALERIDTPTDGCRVSIRFIGIDKRDAHTREMMGIIGNRIGDWRSIAPDEDDALISRSGYTLDCSVDSVKGLIKVVSLVEAFVPWAYAVSIEEGSFDHALLETITPALESLRSRGRTRSVIFGKSFNKHVEDAIQEHRAQGVVQ